MMSARVWLTSLCMKTYSSAFTESNLDVLTQDTQRGKREKALESLHPNFSC